MSLVCSKFRVLHSTLTPPGRANSHFSLSCCSYVTAMTWFHADMEGNDRQSKSSDAGGLLSSSQSGWWWSSELWFVTRVTFHLSLRLRHVHRLSHLSADDPDLWDGHIWCIQGKRVCREFTVPKNRPVVIKVFVFQLRAAWIIPFFCYQIFDFALNTLVAVSIVVYPNTIQDYLQQLVGTALFCDRSGFFAVNSILPSSILPSLGSLITSRTRTRSPLSATSAWSSSFCSSSAAFLDSR